jgi:hypothetical protein
MTPWTNFWNDPTHVRPWTKYALHSWLADYGGLEVVAYGTRRHLLYVPRDLIAMLIFLFRGRMENARSKLQNIVGWSAFAIGRKPMIGSKNGKT